MATKWDIVVRQVAARVNALTGSQSVAAEAAYTTNPVTSAQSDNPLFPFSMIKDACLDVQGIIAVTVANVANHPWRQVLAAETAIIADAGALPSADSAAKPIIGVLGAVRDASNSKVLTEAPIEIIQRYNRNHGAFFDVALRPYLYRIQDRRVHHTRDNVKIDVCSYERADAVTAIGANGDILFPDASVAVYVAGATALLVRESEYQDQAAYFGALFAQMLKEITQGASVISAIQPSSPIKGRETA